MAELHTRAKCAWVEPHSFVNLPVPESLVITWLYTNRPPLPSFHTTGKPMFTFSLSNYSGSPGGSWLHVNVVINWKLAKQGIRWPVSPNCIAHSGVDLARSSTFLKLCAGKLLVFKQSQAQFYFLNVYMKHVVFMSRWPHTIKILISNQPRMRKFSQLFKNTGGVDLLLPSSWVGYTVTN